MIFLTQESKQGLLHFRRILYQLSYQGSPNEGLLLSHFSRVQLFLQGIFPMQGSNPGLLHCRWILYHLSHKGSPRILEWVAYPFSSGSS